MRNRFLLTPFLFLALLSSSFQPTFELFAKEPARHAPLTVPELPTTDAERRHYEDFLVDRYQFDRESIRWGEKYPIILRGTNEKGFFPKIDCDKVASPPKESETYDVVIVGGGPAGMTAAFFLTQKGKRVLLLEKEPGLGGLAIGASLGSGKYGRGGAYFTSVEGPAKEVYKKIGFGNYTKTHAIPEPIDSYLWNGKYYPGLWESEKAMEELPADFAVFKFMLKQADKDGLIANQPIDQAEGTKVLDRLSFSEWINGFPKGLEKLAIEGNPEAKKLSQRLKNDPHCPTGKEMQNVIKLLEIYGRSALGDHPDKISAAAFANFYISEVDTRYTGNLGAGAVTDHLFKKLKDAPEFMWKTRAPVSEVKNTQDGVEVCYQINGEAIKVRGKKAIFAAPLKVAAKAIKDLAKLDPKKKEIIDKMEYRHYLTTNLHVLGHPRKNGEYDLWVRNDKTYDQHQPTDMIDGRWIDFHGTEKVRTDDKGVITVYNPLPKEEVGKGFEEKQTLVLAEKTVDAAGSFLNPLIAKEGGTPVRVLAVEANRWGYSIHIAGPGHFLDHAEILARPVLNTYFAENNLGTPAIEEALYRGYMAAEAILKESIRQGVSRQPAVLGPAEEVHAVPAIPVP